MSGGPYRWGLISDRPNNSLVWGRVHQPQGATKMLPLSPDWRSQSSDQAKA
ncbi:hypothetical protein [Limnospira platensis]|uniref:hypothetical protein n=1 Tax=Limnospira platensis TaxID=118562 RepID=UPI0002DCD1F9|nr:hypothetical protein [Arthrospira platensis]MBD2670327.1 hypothetical protein [Arthrospira platensis FACHB-439]MDF2211418.1 hypothetical protein [Arthrospira platensis NCB002]WAK74240.1 hypothetical protein AP9108_32960 [Arthrospira sp. PCC 9108]